MDWKSPVLLDEEVTIGDPANHKEAELSRPFRLLVDDQGNIYVLDIQDGNIKKYAPDGKFVMTIGRKGQGPGELQGPMRIQMTPEKELLVVCVFTSGLVRSTPEGA